MENSTTLYLICVIDGEIVTVEYLGVTDKGCVTYRASDRRTDWSWIKLVDGKVYTLKDEFCGELDKWSVDEDDWAFATTDRGKFEEVREACGLANGLEDQVRRTHAIELSGKPSDVLRRLPECIQDLQAKRRAYAKFDGRELDPFGWSVTERLAFLNKEIGSLKELQTKLEARVVQDQRREALASLERLMSQAKSVLTELSGVPNQDRLEALAEDLLAECRMAALSS